MRVLDLCCGLGGWSRPWRERGHFVVGVDVVEPCDVLCDVRQLRLQIKRWDVILASPPCTEFTKHSMPWYDHTTPPDLSIVQACIDIAERSKPKAFIMENVVGAQKFIGKCVKKVGSRCLWGWFPAFKVKPSADLYGKWKISPSKDRARLRALIPYSLSLAVCIACGG